MFATKSLKTFADILALLNCVRLPGRLTSGETAVILGFAEHDIAVLIAAKLLVPLGNPAPNAPKYFSAVEASALAADAKWLSRATRTIAAHWRGKNSRKNTL